MLNKEDNSIVKQKEVEASGMAELEAKVEQLQTESIYLKKTINELQTYQSIQQPSLALPQRAINSID